MTDIEILSKEIIDFMEENKCDVVTGVSENEDGTLDVSINDDFYTSVTEKYPDMDFNEVFTELLSKSVEQLTENDIKENSENSENP
jgi:hypothetical protein